MATFIRIALTLCFPITVSLLLLGFGLFFLWRGKAVLRGKVLCTLGFFALLIPSNPWFGQGLLSWREYAHPPLADAQLDSLQGADVVVLGGGIRSNNQLPMVSQLSSVSLQRLIDGARLQRRTGGRLILSGGGAEDHSEARGMRILAEALGTSPDVIVLDEDSINTFQQALALQQILGARPFILVTSADHMPRAAKFFQSVGLNPTLAPTGHRTVPEARSLRNLFRWSYTENLIAWDRHVYEILAAFRSQPVVPEAEIPHAAPAVAE